MLKPLGRGIKMKQLYWYLESSSAGTSPYFETIDQLLQEIKMFLEEEPEHEIDIRYEYMTEEEYKALPEHQGY